jgi:hypothetical protein
MVRNVPFVGPEHDPNGHGTPGIKNAMASEAADTALPVAAGTHTGTSSRAASVRCLFLFCRGCSHADHCLSQAPLDASEAADTALPVAAGTHTGTSSRAASVRCLFFFCRGFSHADHCLSQAAPSPCPADVSVVDDDFRELSDVADDDDETGDDEGGGRSGC